MVEGSEDGLPSAESTDGGIWHSAFGNAMRSERAEKEVPCADAKRARDKTDKEAKPV
jgi:hypothetical protein